MVRLRLSPSVCARSDSGALIAGGTPAASWESSPNDRRPAARTSRHRTRRVTTAPSGAPAGLSTTNRATGSSRRRRPSTAREARRSEAVAVVRPSQPSLSLLRCTSGYKTGPRPRSFQRLSRRPADWASPRRRSWPAERASAPDSATLSLRNDSSHAPAPTETSCRRGSHVPRASASGGGWPGAAARIPARTPA